MEEANIIPPALRIFIEYFLGEVEIHKDTIVVTFPKARLEYQEMVNEHEFELQATGYIHRGGRLILREALPDDDPESYPALFLGKYGLPIQAVFGVNWRESLVDEG